MPAKQKPVIVIISARPFNFLKRSPVIDFKPFHKKTRYNKGSLETIYESISSTKGILKHSPSINNFKPFNTLRYPKGSLEPHFEGFHYSQETVYEF